MALFRTLFKAWLALLLAAQAVSTAQAAEFSARRGINLDQWVTWPQEPTWGQPGVLQPYPEWRKFVSPGDLAALKDAGFDFLRMPVDPSPFLSPETEAIRDRMFDDVLESARMINRAGLKVIVDMHLIPSTNGVGMQQVLTDDGAARAYIDLIRRMARTLANEPADKVAFELMNEPGVDCDAAGHRQWQALQKQLFTAARSSATRLTLVLTGGCMSSAEGLAGVDPADYPDRNILWTFHSYDPFLLTHQGASWAGDFVRYVTGLPYPPSTAARAEFDAALDAIRRRIESEAPLMRRAGMLDYLGEQIALLDTPEKLGAAMAKPFDTVSQWARAHDIAATDILLGEFGMIRQEYGQPFRVPATERAAYYRDMIALAEKAGFIWSMWSYGGAFGIVQEFEGKPAEPEVLDMVKSLN